MGQINKIPQGYLNMLGSQTGGKNPFTANDVVAPTVEMIPFYHGQAMSAVSDVLAAVNPLDSVVRTVPDNEAWFLYSWGFLATSSNIADRLKMILQVSRLPKGGTAAVLYCSTVLLMPLEAVTSYGDSVIFPQPIPLLPGSRLTSTVSAITNNQTMTVSYLVAKFTV